MSQHLFETSGDDVERMGRDFGTFVRRLLEAEAASQCLAGHRLLVSARENDPDGGVDATIVDSPGSRWVPPGTSAWQFKRSEVSTTQLRGELQKSEVRSILAEGGSYCLALGVDLTPAKTRNRQLILEEGLPAGRVRFYQASQLANWANEYPAVLAAQGKFGPLLPHSEWKRRRDHVTTWVADPARNSAIDQIRSQLRGSRAPIRIEGTNGIGKTRLALEALGAQDLAPLVAYAFAETDTDGAFLNTIVRTSHDVILVVDDCSAATHRLLEKRLDTESRIRLVTIGSSGELESVRTGLVRLDTIETQALDELLKQNFRALSDQRRRYVVNASGGVIGFAIQIAEALAPLQEADAVELMRHTDIPGIARFLVGDIPFEVVRALALFRRVGWEGDLAAQAVQLAEWVGIDEWRLRDVVAALEDRGLLARQGRYRLIVPFPVAVSLAAQAWESESDRIVGGLLPGLSREARGAVLGRAADLGRFRPAAEALEGLLAPQGPFGSVAGLERSGEAEMLSYLAVVAPERAARHLSSIIGLASLDELRSGSRSRRSLVWSLEKLAWHPQTFEVAADALLRLSQAENETWSNNATGVWVDLFGARLPSTAALPETRVRYLEDRAADPNPEIRELVADAAYRGVQLSEMRAVSAELQDGTAVREPGYTRDQEADRRYREGMLELLGVLSRDESEAVSNQAAKHLIELGMQLAPTYFWPTYLRVAVGMGSHHLVRLRREARQWLRLAESREERGGAEQIGELVAALEVDDPLEKLRDVGAAPPWSLMGDEGAGDADALLRELGQSGRLPEVWDWLQIEEVPAAYSVGQALARLPEAGEDDFLGRVASASGQNLPVVGGFLDEATSMNLVDRDSFLDSGPGATLSSEQRARLSMARSPSRASLERVKNLILTDELPPRFASVLGLGGWSRHYPDSEFAAVLSHWLPLSRDAADVAATTDLLGLHIHRQERLAQLLVPVSWSVVERRQEFINLGTAEWHWAQIARLLAEVDPVRAANLVFSMIRNGLVTLSVEPEAEVLRRAAELAPEGVWTALVDHLGEHHGTLVEMTVRGWLLEHFSLDVITAWVGDDAERAELVAGLAPLGRTDPGELARWLIVKFGRGDRVRAALHGRLYEGGWTGPMSEWIAGLIGDLEGWADEPAEVREWAQEMVGYLREEQRRVRLEEEERGI